MTPCVIIPTPGPHGQMNRITLVQYPVWTPWCREKIEIISHSLVINTSTQWLSIISSKSLGWFGSFSCWWTLLRRWVTYSFGSCLEEKTVIWMQTVYLIFLWDNFMTWNNFLDINRFFSLQINVSRRTPSRFNLILGLFSAGSGLLLMFNRCIISNKIE